MPHDDFDFTRWQNLLIETISERYQVNTDEAAKIAHNADYELLFEKYKFMICHDPIEYFADHAWRKYHPTSFISDQLVGLVPSAADVKEERDERLSHQ